MAVAKKATTGVAKASTTKPKAPPAKKVKAPAFGQLGYRFPVMMEIVEVNPEDDEYNHPFVVALSLNQYADYDSTGNINGFTFSYASKKDLITDISKHDKKVAKQLKADEIKQVEAVVAKLKKELESL